LDLAGDGDDAASWQRGGMDLRLGGVDIRVPARLGGLRGMAGQPEPRRRQGRRGEPQRRWWRRGRDLRGGAG
jgi:hypothetical protein